MITNQFEESDDCSSINPPDYCNVSSNSGFFVFIYLVLFMYISPYIFIGVCKFIKSCSHDGNIRIEENNNTNANGINDNDIILLPKYQSTQELNDDEITYTLPPAYDNRICTN